MADTKGTTKRIDREIMSLTISLPSPDENILELNRGIEDWQLFDPLTGEIRKVWEGCQMGNNHKLVHYVILYSWFYSPKRALQNPKIKREKCLIDAGIDYDKLPQFRKGDKFGKDDIDFKPGTKGYWYFRHFCAFQLHLPYQNLQRSMALMEKQDEFYEQVDLDSMSPDDAAAILKEMRAYMKEKIGMQAEIYHLHRLMLTQKYTLDALQEEFQSLEDLGMEDVKQGEKTRVKEQRVASNDEDAIVS